ncbi:MAG: hypothetical protein JXB48_09720 [Candidatus Latescibacteria bacterium]|nr:hypothetical protein [Candidatus Latescibacterota bacterium]
MRTAFVFYRKEMKGNFPLFFIPVVLIASAIVFHYLYLDIYYSTKQIPKMFDALRMMTSRVSLYLMPVLLLYALSLESKHSTIYQLHMLPTGKYRSLLYKLLAAMSYVVVWAFLYSIHSRIFVTTKGLSVPKVTLMIVPENTALYIRDFAFSLLSNIRYVSMIVLAWGAAHVVPKYHQLIGLGVFILSVEIYNHLMEFIYRLLLPVISAFNMESGRNGVRYVQISVSMMTCMVLVFIGLYLYERYSEV